MAIDIKDFVEKGVYLKNTSAKIMDRPRRIIHIDPKTESLRQKDDALCLEEPEGMVCYELLKLGETVGTKRSRACEVYLERVKTSISILK